MSSRLAAMFVGLLTVATLAGCGANAGSDDGSHSPSPAQHSPSPAAQTAAEQAVEAAAETAAETPTQAPIDTAAVHDQLVASTVTEVSCSDGELELYAQAVHILGDCDHLSIGGGASLVVAEHVGALTITGHSNVVVARSAKTVSVIGGGNVVIWENGEPQVTDSGAANVTGSANKLDPSKYVANRNDAEG